MLPADQAGYIEAVDGFLTSLTQASHQPPGSPYRAGSDIRFEAGGNASEYIRQGWSVPEFWGCWTSGFRAEMRIPLEHPFENAALLAVEAVAYVRTWHPMLKVRVVCNREPLGGWAIDSRDSVERILPIPATALAGRRELVLLFYLENPASPADSGEFGLDQRLLGLGLQKLRIRAA